MTRHARKTAQPTVAFRPVALPALAAAIHAARGGADRARRDEATRTDVREDARRSGSAA